MLLDSDNQPIVFTGTYFPAWDASNRVMCPSKWQPADKTVRFHLLPWPAATQDYLLALPPDRWNLMLERLSGGSLTDEEAADLERYISGNAHAFTLDKFGRFCLPVEIAVKIGCEREPGKDGTKPPSNVVLVGRLDKFEVWSEKRYREKEAQVRQSVAAALKNKQVLL